MWITGMLCLCAAVLSAALGLWWLTRVPTAETARIARRAMAPAQLAAAIMLAAGGAVALASSSDAAVLVVLVCIAGAVGTVAAGSWQSARFAVRRKVVAGDCAGQCAACALSCRDREAVEP